MPQNQGRKPQAPVPCIYIERDGSYGNYPTARFAHTAGIFFPAAVFRGAPQRAPRAAPGHGRLPMDATPRIASINFPIASTLIYYPIKVTRRSVGAKASTHARTSARENTLRAITLLIFHVQTSRLVILDRNGEILLLRASRAFFGDFRIYTDVR